MKENGIWIPKYTKYKMQLNTDDLKKWYENISIEYKIIPWSKNYYEKFCNYYKEAGLISNPLKRNFFHHHYSRTLWIAITNFFSLKKSNIKILDLGCGMGTQSLLFALLGAEVVGIDIDDVALDIFKIRKSFYEKISGRRLRIIIKHSNAFTFDYEKYGPFDGVYSLFSFNLIQPTRRFMDILCAHLNRGAILLIQDGNKNMWFNRIFRPRKVLSKNELCKEFIRRDIGGIRIIGGYAIPPIFWHFLPNKALKKIDNFLTKFEIFSVSYLYIAKFKS